jgi:hypothetical protein
MIINTDKWLLMRTHNPLVLGPSPSGSISRIKKLETSCKIRTKKRDTMGQFGKQQVIIKQTCPSLEML